MAGFYINSLNTAAFEQLITSPTTQHGLGFADCVLDGLEDALDEYGDDEAANPKKWPLEREALAKSLQKRLASTDWYRDFTMGDAVIWDDGLRTLVDDSGKEFGFDLRCENDGLLYWDAAEIAAQHGAPMMVEPKFGNSGFRYSGKSKSDVDLMYTIYLTQQTQELLHQLEIAAPHFATMPEVEDGDREQFFRGLIEPVRKIVAARRVMWVQTDT